MFRRKQLMLLVYDSLVFIAILMPLLRSRPVQAITSNMTVFPSSLTVGLGQNFDVDIVISDASDLYGWQFALTWNPLLLDAVSPTEGPFLKVDGRSTFFTYNISLEEGRIIVDCTLLGWISGVSGGGILVTLTFSSKNYGECALDLYETLLVDSKEQPILCQNTDGYVHVVMSHDVAVSTVDVFPLRATAGDIVNINVDVQNQGGYAEMLTVTVYVNSTLIGTQQTSLSSGSFANISFTWNTTSYSGDYLVLANIDPVPGEVDLSDNANIAEGLVTILIEGHDIAVIDVVPSQTVVGQSFCMFFNVKVRNFGEYTETINISTTANETIIFNDSITLSSGSSLLLPVFWNASGFSIGKYTIEAYAEPVVGETSISDNACIFWQVTVAKNGDINSNILNTPDGRVDMWDIAAVARQFGTHSGDGLWNGNADITGVTLGLPDGVIDMRDVSIVARSFAA